MNNTHENFKHVFFNKKINEIIVLNQLIVLNFIYLLMYLFKAFL